MNKEMKELLNGREEAKRQAMEEIENILAIAEDRIVKATEESIKDVIEVATEIAEGIMDETKADIEEVLERLIYKGKKAKKNKKAKIRHFHFDMQPRCNVYSKEELEDIIKREDVDKKEEKTPQNKQIIIEVVGGKITEEKLAILMAMLRHKEPYDARVRVKPRIFQI